MNIIINNFLYKYRNLQLFRALTYYNILIVNIKASLCFPCMYNVS